MLFPAFLNVNKYLVLGTSQKVTAAKQAKSPAVLGTQTADLTTTLSLPTTFSFVGTNILRNSSFEQNGLGSKPQYWNYQLDSATGNTFTTNEGIHSGSYGLKFVGSKGAGKGLDLGISQPDAKTVSNRTYTLSAYLKVVNATSVSIRIGFWDEQNNRYSEMKTFNYQGTFDWKRISMNVTTTGLITDSKNYYPMIEVRGLKDGSVYMDDVQLEEGNTLTAFNSASAYAGSVIPGNGSILGSVNGDLYPGTSGVGNLGATENKWNNLYLSNATIDKDGNINSNGNLTIGGVATVSGGLTINNNAILGNSSSNTITANGLFNSSLIPSATITYDLGSSSLYWNNLYAKTLNISGGQSIGGNFNVTGTLGVTGASTFGSNITQTAGTNSLALSSSTTAFNVNSGLFNIDTQNSRIGIGTTTPGQAMEVNGTVKSQGFILGTLNGLLKGVSGVLGLASGGTDFENPLTFSYPLARSSNAISLNYNAANLQLTSNSLNTIQDIATTSTPTFAGLQISNNATVSGTLSAKTGRTATYVIAASDSSARSKQQADYVADGVADQVEIQAAIDAIASLPGTTGSIVLLEGNYFISATISLNNISRNGLSIRGQGIGTRLVLNSGVNSNMFEYTSSSPALFFEFRDMTLDGGTGNTSGSGIYMSGNTGDGLIFASFIVNFPDDDLYLANTWAWKISDSTFEYAGRYGINAPNVGQSDLRINNTKFLYNNVGINLQTYLSSVVGNYFHKNKKQSIIIGGQSNSIIGNNFDNSSWDYSGVYSDIEVNGLRNIVTGNSFWGYNITKHGILIGAEGDYLIAKDNVFLMHPDVAISGVLPNSHVYDYKYDTFQNIQTNTTTYIHTVASADNSQHTDTVHPDVPRGVRYTLRNNTGGVSSGNATTVTFTGIDQKGNSISEDLVFTTANLTNIADGGTVAKDGQKAFSKVNSIQSSVAQPTNWNFYAGISTRLGLSGPIYEVGDIYKMRKNTTDVSVPSGGSINYTYGTVDVGSITTGDNFVIYYKSNSNIIQ